MECDSTPNRFPSFSVFKASIKLIRHTKDKSSFPSFSLFGLLSGLENHDKVQNIWKTSWFAALSDQAHTPSINASHIVKTTCMMLEQCGFVYEVCIAELMQTSNYLEIGNEISWCVLDFIFFLQLQYNLLVVPSASLCKHSNYRYWAVVLVCWKWFIIRLTCQWGNTKSDSFCHYSNPCNSLLVT